MKIETAVRRLLRTVPAGPVKDAYGSLALRLAHLLDTGEVVSTAPNCARELRATLDQLRQAAGGDGGADSEELSVRVATMARCGWDPGDDPVLLDLGKSMTGFA